jgi:uncharacterized protein
VAFEPADAHAECQSLAGDRARTFPQQGETLGDRMRNAFGELFARGYTRVVAIGSDLPTLPARYVEQAFDRLRDRSGAIVVGPAIDGGYYLIGLREAAPELFDAIPWSTRGVLAATRQAAEKLNLVVHLTPEWYDVDEPADLDRVVGESTGGARTRSWVGAQRALDQGAPGHTR